MVTLHQLTVETVAQAVQDLLVKGCTHILDEYTCHLIADDVRIRLQEQYDWTCQDAQDQACVVSKVLERLGRIFCEERDYDIHYSFILNHVDQQMLAWEPERKFNHVCYRTAVHAMRVDWLLFLQQDLRG